MAIPNAEILLTVRSNHTREQHRNSYLSNQFLADVATSEPFAEKNERVAGATLSGKRNELHFFCHPPTMVR